MTKYKYISNAPYGQDLFGGKAHEHAVTKIVELFVKLSNTFIGWI